MSVQQWLLENVLGLTPAEEHERPVKRTQEDKWALNFRAARQYRAREGHLNVPRPHVEMVGDQPVKLGTFIDNTRRRADKLTAQCHTDLNALDMRWTGTVSMSRLK
ncbi:helicase associated domain-containing protein [Streptomyces abikoensis]|uniref:helicase associated domain-containing protein n=1 Tax=Streptomyces abikoensis TaxID=97398 RepID=UPI0033FD9BFF